MGICLGGLRTDVGGPFSLRTFSGNKKPASEGKGEAVFMKFSGKGLFTILGILLIAAGLVYLLWGGLEENVVYFVTPTELLEKGEAAVGNPVRLGGVVQGGSLQEKEGIVTFSLTDEVKTVLVVTTKTPPQMFHEGIGAVVEGALRKDGIFEANRLMVKHGNEYRPPKEGERPQQIYKAIQQEKRS